jgi:hypothetical protein
MNWSRSKTYDTYDALNGGMSTAVDRKIAKYTHDRPMGMANFHQLGFVRSYVPNQTANVKDS